MVTYSKKRQLPRPVKADTVGYPNGASNSLHDIKYEVITSYKNYLSYPVTLVDRTGLPIRLDTIDNQLSESGLVIERRYRLYDSTYTEVRAFQESLAEESQYVHGILKGQVEADHRHFRQGTHDIVIEFNLSEQRMNQVNRNCYLDELDLLIYFSDIEPAPFHPYSSKGKLNAYKEQEGPGFIYRVTINDPRNEFGDKFINIGGQVYRIIATSDPLKPAGVYLFSTKATGTETFDELVSETRYDFEEVKQYIPLYNNVEDARTLGDLATEKKRELEETTHKHKLTLTELEHQRKLEQFKHEQEIMALKRQLDLAEAEAKQRAAFVKETLTSMDTDEAYRKRIYESSRADRTEKEAFEKFERERRANFRKELLDALKWVPPLIIGIATLATKFKVVSNG